MKAKHLCLGIAALLAGGGLWFGRSAWQTHASKKSSMDIGFVTPQGPNLEPNSAASLPAASQSVTAPVSTNRPELGQMLNSPAQLAPPIPNRRFTDFTPEQRVQFARQGHGPGG